MKYENTHDRSSLRLYSTILKANFAENIWNQSHFFDTFFFPTIQEGVDLRRRGYSPY